MEGREAMGSGGGITVMGSYSSSNYRVVESTQNPNQIGGSNTVATSMSISVAGAHGDVKKKRGRPRKYGPDGTFTRTVSLALSPMPISYSAPTGEFSGDRRGRGRPTRSVNRPQQKVEVNENLGNWVSCSVGANFMPHIITVAAGEDVTMKIISFSQQGPRAICVLSANGLISNVTVRQPDSSGGTLTYEGRFEILSLSGSFMPSESGGTRSLSGGLSVSLSSPDGRVVGGGVAGLLVAATPVQVVVGSFLPCTQLEQKPKKQKHESTLPVAPVSAVSVSSMNKEERRSGQDHQNSTIPKTNLNAGASFRGENSDPSHQHPFQDSRNPITDINIPLAEED